jgi:hypothetical protein
MPCCLVAQHAQQVQGIRVPGLLADELSVGGLCLGILPIAVESVSGLEEVVQRCHAPDSTSRLA